VKLDALHELSTASLRALSQSLLEGSLAVGITGYAVQQIDGAQARRLEACLLDLRRDGIDAKAIALIATAIADARELATDASSLFEVVLSGPELQGVPTSDTAATMRSLVAQARSEILLVGYAVHNGKVLFVPVAERMTLAPHLTVISGVPGATLRRTGKSYGASHRTSARNTGRQSRFRSSTSTAERS
jgi:hypothetical protein